MVTRVAELVTPRTADRLEAEALATLAAEGFPATSWQSGSVPRSLVKADAQSLARLDATVADLARGNFLDDATGDWLSLHAASRFSTPRSPATYTEGYVQITVASGVGPYTLGPFGLLVTDGVRRWRSTNTANLTVTSAAPTNVPVRAETAGTAYNVSNNLITQVVSPANAGMSVSNPAYALGTWITLTGTDAESDASLRARCRARWSTLGRGANTAAYQFWATTAPTAATVTRAKVTPGPGDGTLTIYVAQATSVATGPQVAAVQSYVDSQRPVTDAPTVTAASAVSVAVTGAVTFASATYNTTDAHTAITDALTAYITSKGFGDTIDLGGLFRAIYDAAPGVVNVDLVAPAADVVLSGSQIGLAGAITLSWSP